MLLINILTILGHACLRIYAVQATPSQQHRGKATELYCVVVALLFYVHGKHLRSCRDGQLTYRIYSKYSDTVNVRTPSFFLKRHLFYVPYISGNVPNRVFLLSVNVRTQ